MSRKINPPPREELEEKYSKPEYSISRLAREYGVSNPTVRKWLIDYGIERKSLAEVNATLPRGERVPYNKGIRKADTHKPLAIEYLGYLPGCKICGKEPAFETKNKTQTPYGSWKTYCSVSCMSGCPETIDKREKTSLERYGVTHFSKIQEFDEVWPEERKAKFRERVNITCQEKHGVDWPSQYPTFNEKRTKTSLERYGVHNTWLLADHSKWRNSEEGKEHLASMHLYVHTSEAKLKARITRLENKGVDREFIDILVNEDSDGFRTYIDKVAETLDHPSRHNISNAIGLSRPYVNQLFLKFGFNDLYNFSITRGEKEIQLFLDSLGIDYQINDRKILDGFELDIWVPDHKLAIEFNGIYWHSVEFGRDDDYHLFKTVECEKQGIRLLHVIESEWYNPIDKIKWEAIIKRELGLLDKIDVSECSVELLNIDLANEFLNVNSLYRFEDIEEFHGIYHKEELVGIISVVGDEIALFAQSNDVELVGDIKGLLGKFGNVLYEDRRFSSTLKTIGEFCCYPPMSGVYDGYEIWNSGYIEWELN